MEPAIMYKARRIFRFEKNPKKRRLDKQRLLKRIIDILDELSIKTGQQAVVTVANLDTQQLNIFGSKPLENVMRELEPEILAKIKTEMENMKSADLFQDAANAGNPVDNKNLFELPALSFDGVEIAVENMTQQQLRCFIPLILKYSTGRGKPGWGKEEKRPPWWPQEVPWSNVRLDTRSEEKKTEISWTNALRCVVKSCYKYHGREDLMPKPPQPSSLIFRDSKHHSILHKFKKSLVDKKPKNVSNHLGTQTVINPDGSMTVVKLSEGENAPPENGADFPGYDENNCLLTGVDDQGHTVFFNGYISPGSLFSIQSNGDGVLFLVPLIVPATNEQTYI